MKKKTILYLSLILVSFFANAQQTPHFTQYLYNMQVINPAYVGVRADLSASALARYQWLGIKGAPETKTFSVNGRLSNGIGIGVTIVNDKIGLAQGTETNFDISYTTMPSLKERISFGLKGGVTFFNNNLSKGITPDNETYNSVSKKYTNIGFGMHYYNKIFSIGVAIPYLFKTPHYKITGDNNIGGISESIDYFFTSSARFKLSKNVMFKPSTMVKLSSNLPVSIDFNTNFLIEEVVELGLSYRHNDSVSAMFAVFITENTRLGYSYDHTLTDLGSNLNTHELVLHFDINFEAKPRWLYHKCYF